MTSYPLRQNLGPSLYENELILTSTFPLPPFPLSTQHLTSLTPTHLNFTPSHLTPFYSAGARLHSDSWGGAFWYDAFCAETDQFLYENDDFLVFFAGGNNGGEGYRTILSPALSKNAVAVAASYNDVNNIGTIPDFSSTGDYPNPPSLTPPPPSHSPSDTQSTHTRFTQALTHTL